MSHTPRPPRALALGFACVAVLTGLADPGVARAARPNVVVLQTDDQPAGTVTRRVMPQTHRLLVRPGTTFENYIATTPLCCPSRASLLSGQYGHNNGVLSNDYSLLRQKRNVLPIWLWRAGYRTSHVGKFMNHYPLGGGAAPGWDRWAATATGDYYDYRLFFDHGYKLFGSKPRDHLGRVVGRRAASEIPRLSGRRPFYLQADFPAPHRGPEDPTGRCARAPVPEPRDARRFRNATAPRPTSFNEVDISDKPQFIAGRDALDARQLEDVDRSYGCMLAALRSVDRGVHRIVQALAREDELANTAIVFVADNGVFFGHHRIAEGKHFPYEEATRVPLVVRLPRDMRAQAPEAVSGLAANIDLAPTILDFAHAEPCARIGHCRIMDGVSLAAPLRGEPSLQRDLLLEIADPSPFGRGMPCTYGALRTQTSVYVEHELAEAAGRREPCEPIDAVEHYELPDDPFQTENLFPAAPGSGLESAQLDLAQRLSVLRGCAGVLGRDQAVDERPFCAAE